MIDLGRPMRGCPVAILDLETTGFETGARIVEVAVVRIDAFGSADPEVVYESLVNPEEPIPFGASQVHGIRDRDVRGSPTWDRVWPTVLELLQEAVPAAHNVSYDHRILAAEADILGSHGLPDKSGWLDTLTLLRRLDEKPAKLETACARRGISAGRHRAAADAMATALLLPRLLSECYRQPALGAPQFPTVAQLLWWMGASKKERERSAPPPPEQGALLSTPKKTRKAPAPKPTPTAMPPLAIEAVSVPVGQGLKAEPAPVVVDLPPPPPVQPDLLSVPLLEQDDEPRAPRTRGPRMAWGVKGGVGANMFLTNQRGIDGSYRWTISPKNARKFHDQTEAIEVAGKCGGRPHPFKVVLG